MGPLHKPVNLILTYWDVRNLGLFQECQQFCPKAALISLPLPMLGHKLQTWKPIHGCFSPESHDLLLKEIFHCSFSRRNTHPPNSPEKSSNFSFLRLSTPADALTQSNAFETSKQRPEEKDEGLMPQRPQAIILSVFPNACSNPNRDGVSCGFEKVLTKEEREIIYNFCYI